MAAWQADVAQRVCAAVADFGAEDVSSEAGESDAGCEAPRAPGPASRMGCWRRLHTTLPLVACSMLAAASVSFSILLSLICLLPALTLLFGLTFRSVTGMGGGEVAVAAWDVVGRAMADGCRAPRVAAWVRRLRRGPPQYSHAAARMPPWILRRRGRRQV